MIAVGLLVCALIAVTWFVAAVLVGAAIMDHDSAAVGVFGFVAAFAVWYALGVLVVAGVWELIT